MKHTELISQMTLEEKASLLSGANFWNTKPVPPAWHPGHDAHRRPPTVFGSRGVRRIIWD